MGASRGLHAGLHSSPVYILFSRAWAHLGYGLVSQEVRHSASCPVLEAALVVVALSGRVGRVGDRQGTGPMR